MFMVVRSRGYPPFGSPEHRSRKIGFRRFFRIAEFLYGHQVEGKVKSKERTEKRLTCANCRLARGMRNAATDFYMCTTFAQSNNWLAVRNIVPEWKFSCCCSRYVFARPSYLTGKTELMPSSLQRELSPAHITAYSCQGTKSCDRMGPADSASRWCTKEESDAQETVPNVF